jgi:cyclic dehypoxanthinyl futalosine synthase
MHRVTFDNALAIFANSSIHELGNSAQKIRLEKHPDKIVTYVSDRNINYTNICVSGCQFCAFHANPGSSAGWVLSDDELYRKIDEAKSAGATQILIQGGMHPDFGISYYKKLLQGIKSKYAIHIHGFSPPEIQHISNLSGIPTLDVIKRLIDAGLDTIPGGGAEILSDEIRSKVSPRKCSSDQWIQIMREAHSCGLKTSATMMFGLGEKIENRIEHLMRIRDLQDQTGGFTAFIPWTFQPSNTMLSDRTAPDAVEYLRMLALSRIVLDNVDNIQASWVTQGEKIGQLALFFGANDMGGTMMEENVVRAAGCENRLSESRLREIVERAGFVPKKRDTVYRVIE